MSSIGIIGLAGTGKDTVAKILSELTGLPVVRLADPLKRAAEKVFGRNFDNRDVKEVEVPFYGHKIEDRAIEAAMDLCRELGYKREDADVFQELFFEHLMCHTMSPRKFQQLLGTEVCRTIEKDCFARLVYEKAPCIVPDVRFPNELQTKNLLVKRDDIKPVNAHASERMAYAYTHATELPSNVQVIMNNGSIEDLKTRLRDYL